VRITLASARNYCNTAVAIAGCTTGPVSVVVSGERERGSATHSPSLHGTSGKERVAQRPQAHEGTRTWIGPGLREGEELPSLAEFAEHADTLTDAQTRRPKWVYNGRFFRGQK